MGWLTNLYDWSRYYGDVAIGDRNAAAQRYADLTNEGAGDVVAGPQDAQQQITQQDVNEIAPPGSTYTSYSDNLSNAANKWVDDNKTALIGIGVGVGLLATIYVLVQLAPLISLVKK